jgi:uncharacterized protein YcsI (UPF0317 family)
MDRHANPAVLRAAMRSGAFSDNTSGFAPGYVQCNLVVLPEAFAADFLRFCQANPKPCPLLAVSQAPGDPTLPALGDIDIRSDLPRYRVFEDGEMTAEPLSIADRWRDDFVAFALGCSFSFEEALLADGLEVRNVSLGCNVPMYRTTLPCTAAGRFHGAMVASMRPFRAADAIRAIQISTRFPAVHGAPVHLGDPALIGITDLAAPDYGDAVPVAAEELPVFWACGVTPQVALVNARPPIAITHSPGCMLVTDLSNSRLAVL